MKTKTLKLISLNAQKYQDIEIECRVVANIKEYVSELIKEQGKKTISPQLAQKTSKVEARLGEIGEKVDTRVRVERNGHIYVIGETQGAVKIEGSMIVKNPDGEEYVVKPEVFAKKYAKTKEEGIYSPISSPIKYILLTEDIVFQAPWGEEMFALSGAAINITNLDNIYAIQNEAFKKTYTKFQNKDLKYEI